MARCGHDGCSDGRSAGRGAGRRDYAKQAAHTDAVIAARDWDVEAVGRDENTGKPFALRYIITHLIAETTRHNGHLDILRELADGVTGD